METQSKELFLNFTKMHGLRNDFILINETKNEVVLEKNKSEVTKILCDRQKGIGADGIIFLSMPTKLDYDICFRIFNPVGTEAGMCGNGIRCFTKFVHDNKILGENLIYNVETRAGLRIVEVCSSKPDSSVIKVDMGVAEFSQHKIPFVYKAELVIDCNPQDEIIEKEIIITSNLKVKISAVSVGIPHAVIITDCILDILEIGPHLEIHDCFPERVNVHCMKINTQKNEFFSASWEAFVGHTLACGTGATSCALIGVKLGYLRKNEIIHANLEGGKLEIVVSDTHDGKLRATMKGEAVKVFDGTMKIYL